MHHHVFKTNPENKYKVVLLVKQSTFSEDMLRRNYVRPLVNQGMNENSIIALTLKYDDSKKVSAKTVKEYVPVLMRALAKIEAEYLYVTDGTYFKALTGEKKTEVHLGYVLPCAVPGFEHIMVVYGINYQVLTFAPDKRGHMLQGLVALMDHVKGIYEEPGNRIIHSESYPDTVPTIRSALAELHKYEFLSCDIEGFGLGLGTTGVGTITFAWTQHDFIAFKVDLKELENPFGPVDKPPYSVREDNAERRELLKEFFTAYKGALRFHHACFDVKHLIYHLWMKDPLDYEGTMTGLDIMTRDLHCTRVISYLATNSCAGNHLGLKYQAQEFAGNYAEDEIKDITKIPVKKLLRYNGVDGMCTNFVLDKHYPTLITDQQLELYNGLMRDSLRLIINIELVGLPMCPKKVVETKKKLEDLQQGYFKSIQQHPLVVQLNDTLQIDAMEKANAKLVKKQHPIEHFKDVIFNPGSPLQLQKLLYDVIGLPVIEKTDSGQPATGGKVIKRLLKHPTALACADLLQAIRDWGAVSKIVSAFMPAFENGMLKADGMRYLHGCFNLGGTVSGRLSSSDPNMQNLDLWVPL